MVWDSRWSRLVDCRSGWFSPGAAHSLWKLLIFEHQPYIVASDIEKVGQAFAFTEDDEHHRECRERNTGITIFKSTNGRQGNASTICQSLLRNLPPFPSSTDVGPELL
nr:MULTISPECIES: hypothetical protein [Agrobacterium]MDX8311503.1 hypothetical protein [Agrobacterium sp. rho-13.3]